MKTFVYEGLPARVLFGSGTLTQLGEEVGRLGIKRAVVLATPQQEPQARALSDRLGAVWAGVFAGATMHTPVERTEEALAFVRQIGADGTVALGGGSTIGLGKAIALRGGIPQIAIPTTYAGSEMTPIIGQTENGIKTTQRTLAVLPKTVIYDVDLTLTLPAAISGTSGMNAIAHAVEALYAKDRNPVISLIAEDGIAALARVLPRISEDPQDRVARSDALYGAWLCGTCLGAVSMALHHKLCHVLGGTFDLPHAETHTAILPHATAYNAGAAPEAMTRVARALGRPDPPRVLYELAGRLGAKRSLRELGMPRDGIERAVEQTMATPYPNPRPLDASAIRELIVRAWEGEPPHSG